MKRLLLGFLILLVSHSAMALIYNAGNLSFSTVNQSLWGSGDGITPESVSYNLNLDSDLEFGGIVGSRNEVLIAGFSETFAAITTPVYVPPYYKCTQYKTSFIGTRYCADGYWAGDYTYNQVITDAYTVTTDPVIADTRFGTEVKLSTRGNVSLTSNFGVNGGTVDANVEYSNVELEIPDEIEVGQFFNLNPSSAVNSSLTTKTPNLEGSVSSRIDFSVGYSATECLFPGSCSSSSGTIFSIPATETTVLEVNTDNLDPDKSRVFEIDEILGYDATFDATQVNLSADIYALPTPGIYLTGLPLLPSGQGIGINVLELGLDAPGRFDVSSDANGAIKAKNIVNDIVRLDYDLGSFQQIPTGAVLTAGALEFRGDILDVDLTPTIDFNQQIEFKSDLMVELTFSSAVYISEPIITGEQVVGCRGNNTQLIGQACFRTTNEPIYTQNCFLGMCTQILVGYETITTEASSAEVYGPVYGTQRVAVTSITAPWDDLPPIALIDDAELSVVPKFWINNEFKNQTWFDYDLNVAVGLLKGSLDFSILELWDDCLFCEDFLVANLGDFGAFDETFSLQGFDSQNGNTFTLSSRSLPVDNNAVSEPSILALMGLGIFGLVLSRRKMKK